MARKVPLWTFIEREAARLGIPDWHLWLLALPAIISGSLRATHPDRLPGGHSRPFKEWLADFLNYMTYHRDPASGRKYLELILVSPPTFRAWHKTIAPPKPGPKPGENNFLEQDLKILDRMRDMMASGKERSPYGAAMAICRDAGSEALAGHGTVASKCKRVAARYHDIFG